MPSPVPQASDSAPDHPAVEALFEAARAVRERAHAPYSRFRVGAALVDEAGRIHAGCNVENAAYPVGSCAEAGAISAMIAGGGTCIAAIVVLGEGPTAVTPCGACRQRIREFAAPDTPVLAADPMGLRARFTLDELLPASFGPENLA
ncbi:cytidine deaminase [Methylobacterium gnaphalii]|uniref:Cytidine deaminase n=1 Tax=Methylobacterium gnaphalii TaxID=1010610 RepID=A0A512JGN7_9HYPH|nr:cytidine deaminase [Methylobacterium gnaphalii]GEP09121.1 cytidine deaminase [Methylobacterium gnaphalii]GJD68435.1 Cytidine deaminase [Methylobacterium gnaphalii]GLS50562.1 cytidine deaminase [Methylobacterium gnaphalii]